MCFWRFLVDKNNVVNSVLPSYLGLIMSKNAAKSNTF